MSEKSNMDEVVFDGIRFLESLTRHYGPEKGIAVWEQMGEVMGDEVKGKIFFAMLAGDRSNRVRVRVGTCTQAVSAIKAIRMATGYSLKEAKDAWDRSKDQVVTIDNVQLDAKHELVRTLRDLGMIVS
jgi:ribosomal protein L7/L12